MLKTMKKILVFLAFALLVTIPAFAAKWSVKMADSEMKRCPELWQYDFGKRLYFGYTQGLGGLSYEKMFKATGEQKYWDYVYSWADTIIGKDGSILLYKRSEYNLDMINAGKTLFDLYAKTGEARFRMAMDTLLLQFEGHPRTADGGFWHKKVYTHQMWLDGLYMASPFLSQYGATFNRPDCIDLAVHQLLTVAKHTYDPKAGLFKHAWDESRSQKWADSITGQSPNFWGRSIGWYAMALVDNLDFIPANHPKRGDVLKIVKTMADGMMRYQDAKTGLWYQVVDQGNRTGNYLEGSVSSMMTYFYAKAVNKGYLPKSYKCVATKAFKGITKNLIKQHTDGTISITHCCAVAGLGGKPYRNGTYEYYIGETVRDNDGKATGVFMQACLELKK
jgi:unsaturated rhamnogalacturonyl hydrolase